MRKKRCWRKLKGNSCCDIVYLLCPDTQARSALAPSDEGAVSPIGETGGETVTIFLSLRLFASQKSTSSLLSVTLCVTSLLAEESLAPAAQHSEYFYYAKKRTHRFRCVHFYWSFLIQCHQPAMISKRRTPAAVVRREIISSIGTVMSLLSMLTVTPAQPLVGMVWLMVRIFAPEAAKIER